MKTGLVHFECGGAEEGSGWFSFWLELGTLVKTQKEDFGRKLARLCELEEPGGRQGTRP